MRNSAAPVRSTHAASRFSHHRGDLRVDEVEDDEGHGGVPGEQLPEMVLERRRKKHEEFWRGGQTHTQRERGGMSGGKTRGERAVQQSVTNHVCNKPRRCNAAEMANPCAFTKTTDEHGSNNTNEIGRELSTGAKKHSDGFRASVVTPSTSLICVF